MVLEATMIIIDNSEYMRNGDYTPVRFDAQADAVNLIFSAKTKSNPESAVGLMTMAGQGPEVLVTLTTDFGKILSSIAKTKVHGSTHLTTAIQVAALALKHRQNKAQRQRIIAFVGSPIDEDEKDLIKLAKKMKKNNISVDFISFGEESENNDKLEKFIANVKSGETNHLLSIPPGPHLISDVIASSNVLVDEDGISQVSGAPVGANGAGASSSSADAFEFGVDPNLDPELALALRMSLEEERSRQEKEKKDRDEAEKVKAVVANAGSIPEQDDEGDQIIAEASTSSHQDANKRDEEPGKDVDKGPEKMETD
ncbi:hypothetical protein V1514DRAFT_294128 [Lipomyces japonicus]|uniref:uncharacterized protein n=1 Tax=Lipomyces japonicus TaxID=56871 RepID=UPI0034CFC31C